MKVKLVFPEAGAGGTAARVPDRHDRQGPPPYLTPDPPRPRSRELAGRGRERPVTGRKTLEKRCG